MKIENLLTCTGCFACYSSCPKSAIKMKQNLEGFLYPVIDKDQCIACGLCENVCPALNLNNKEDVNTKVYAAINNHEEVRIDSSSGGIFSALAEEIILEKGIVFATKFDKNFSAVHSWTNNIDALKDFRGSKYLQSIIGDSYKECKSFLESGRKVLFSGTPCQIQGLKKYLGKEYENLLTIDFICHGVPSPLLWQKYVDFRIKKEHSIRRELSKIAFRCKNNGWKQFSLSFLFKDNNEYCKTVTKDPYMQIFLKDVALRESCYKCPCRGVNRSSDITLADFWGIENILPELDDDKGVSVVISHSEIGNLVLDEIKSKCLFKEVNIVDVTKYNPVIISSPKQPKKRKLFYIDLQRYPFSKIIKKYAKTPIFMKMYSSFYRIAIATVKKTVGEKKIKSIKKFLGRSI